MGMPPAAAQPVAAIHGPAVAGQPAKPTVKPSTARFGSRGMSARATGGTSSFSQGGTQVAQKMSSSSPSQVTAKMSDAGRAAMNAPKAPAVAGGVARGMLGTAVRVAANPVVGGVAAAMTPTPANSGENEKARQAAYGQSLPNVAPGQGSTKNVAPVAGGSIAPNAGRTTAPATPAKQTFGQAFAAARAKAAEIGAKSTGSFEYGKKTYQTNLAPAKGAEKYVAPSKQTDTGIKAEPAPKPVDNAPLPPSRPKDLDTTTSKTTTDNTPSNAQTQTTPTTSSATTPDEKKVKASVAPMNESVMIGDNKYRIV